MAPDTKIPNNAEIDQALKEFEMNAAAERSQVTPGVPKTSETPNNTEISQALKEFEMKSGGEQLQKEQEVSEISELPKMVQLVIKYSGGAIKEQRQAEYLLFGLVVVMIIVSLFLFFRGGNVQQQPSAETLEQTNRMMPVNN